MTIFHVFGERSSFWIIQWQGPGIARLPGDVKKPRRRMGTNLGWGVAGRDLEGPGGSWRDLEGPRGTWRDLEGPGGNLKEAA